MLIEDVSAGQDDILCEELPDPVNIGLIFTFNEMISCRIKRHLFVSKLISVFSLKINEIPIFIVLLDEVFEMLTTLNFLTLWVDASFLAISEVRKIGRRATRACTRFLIVVVFV